MNKFVYDEVASAKLIIELNILLLLFDAGKLTSSVTPVIYAALG